MANEVHITTSAVAAILDCTTQYVRDYLDLVLAPVVTVTPKGYKRRRYSLATVLAFKANREATLARRDADRYARDPHWFEKGALRELKRERRKAGK